LPPDAYDLFPSSGKFSFHGRSLHHISNVPNPYEQGISILGQTLSKFDEDNLIPCFGFGDGKDSRMLDHFSHSIICLNLNRLFAFSSINT
jgi:hypothetical protein